MSIEKAKHFDTKKSLDKIELSAQFLSTYISSILTIPTPIEPTEYLLKNDTECQYFSNVKALIGET